LWGKFWDDPQREFDGLYHLQNLVAIALVVLKIQKFEYFARLASKRLFTPILGCFVVKIGGNGLF